MSAPAVADGTDQLSSDQPTARAGISHPFLVCALPTLLAILWLVLPLARGSDTLFLRDVFSTHLPLKAAQAEALRDGRFPLIDPHRDGGQPLAGNPNAVPFYPDNLLLLVGGERSSFDTIWALNAHFWLHWLLAIPAMFWLARALGMSRPAAWATGVLWATSGYFLSQLCFYNLVAGVALTPAFAAAWLRCRRAPDGRRLAAVAALWALLLVSGDPLIAALALALAVSAGLQRAEPDQEAGAAPGMVRRWLLLAAALALGTLVAAPQWVEFWRALAGSFRALYGYSHASSLVASVDPRQLLDLLLALPFGRPDRLGAAGFWGQRFYTGTLPYYWSLYPGLATLALAAAAPLRRREAGSRGSHRPVVWWCWGWVAVALFFALGRFNPLASWLFALPGLRYPVKLILPAALGLTLLAGLGFDAALVAAQPPARRRAGWTLAAAALLLAVIAGWTLAAPQAAERTLAGWMNDAPSAVAAATRLAAAVQRARWAQAALASLALAAGLGLALRLARSRPAAGAALLLVLHASGQWFFLHPLAPTDAALPYRLAPALLDEVAPSLRLAHGASGRLFGSSQLYRGHYPDDGAHWPVRRAFHELYPLGAALWGRAYSLDLSPEGLSSFETTIAREAVIASPDEQRLRLLAAWGVDRLLLDRPLAPEATGLITPLTTPLTTMPSFGGQVTVHALPNAAPPVQLSHRVRQVDGPQEAFAAMTDPTFDPQRDLVIEGGATGYNAAGDEVDDGTVEVLEDSAERFAANVSTPVPALLALRRSYLTLYRATIDGQPATPRVVNMHQLGLPVPAGNHQVQLWIDRRPLQIASGASLLGLLVLLILTLAPGKPRVHKNQPP